MDKEYIIPSNVHLDCFADDDIEEKLTTEQQMVAEIKRNGDLLKKQNKIYEEQLAVFKELVAEVKKANEEHNQSVTRKYRLKGGSVPLKMISVDGDGVVRCNKTQEAE